MKYRKNLRTVYSSRRIVAANEPELRLWNTATGLHASELPESIKQTIEELANRITFDTSSVDNSIIDPEVYVAISNYSLLNLRDRYDGHAYNVYLEVVVDYGKYVVDPNSKWYTIQYLSYSPLTYQYWIFDNGEYEYKWDKSSSMPNELLNLLEIYQKYGADGSEIKFFNDARSAERYYDSLQRKASNEFGPISKKQILEDAKEALRWRKGIRYRFAGVYEEMSEISLDDLKEGNYDDDDRIAFQVDVSYNGKKSFVAVEYEYQSGAWVCITTNYDFSDESAEILREIDYPMD